MCGFLFFKQKTAYELRISDWSSTCALPILELLQRISLGTCVAILHLGPACESWTHQMSQAVERELLRQLLHISGLFGPGPHDAEIAAEHVQYLRELIKVSLPQHLANWGDARVVFERPLVATVTAPLRRHRPELQDRHRFATLTDACP